MHRLNVLAMCCAGALFAFVMAFHVATFFAINPLMAWPWYVFVIPGLPVALCVVALCVNMHAQRLHPTGGGDLNRAPRWMNGITTGWLVYYLATMGFYMASVPGNLEISAGHYAIVNHGHLVRTLSADEYDGLIVLRMRMTSGLFLLVFWLMFAYFASVFQRR
jgi:hypothetical protein